MVSPTMAMRHQPDFFYPTKQAMGTLAPKVDRPLPSNGLPSVQVPGQKGFPETHAKIDKSVKRGKKSERIESFRLSGRPVPKGLEGGRGSGPESALLPRKRERRRDGIESHSPLYQAVHAHRDACAR